MIIDSVCTSKVHNKSHETEGYIGCWTLKLPRQRLRHLAGIQVASALRYPLSLAAGSRQPAGQYVLCWWPRTMRCCAVVGFLAWLGLLAGKQGASGPCHGCHSHAGSLPASMCRLLNSAVKPLPGLGLHGQQEGSRRTGSTGMGAEMASLWSHNNRCELSGIIICLTADRALVYRINKQ